MGKRILVIGGYAPSLVNFRGPLLRALCAAGHEVLACAGEADEVVVKTLAGWGVRYEAALLARTGLNPFADWAYCRRLRALLRRERPDVILAYTHKPVVFSALASARLDPAPRCYALITGLGYAFSAADSLKKRLAQWLLCALYRRASRHFTGVLFQNPDDQALFRALALVKPGTPQLVVRGSGIDLSAYGFHPLSDGYSLKAKIPAPALDSLAPKVRNQEPITESAPRFLLIARMLADKGIREYVTAARQIKAEFPAVEFHLVGPADANPSAIPVEELKQWCAEGVISYQGARADVRPALRECAVFTLPSFYREGTPRTLLEAMAIGRAVITTDAPGCRETVFEAGPADDEGVREGRNGFLVPTKSSASLVAAMRRFIEQPELVVRMGREGRRMAEEYYDVRKVNGAMLRFMGLGEGI